MRRKPAGFPDVMIRSRVRRYPALPLQFEKELFGLTAVHVMLTEPRFEELYWGPMRRGDFRRIPVAAEAFFTEDASCQIALHFDA